MPAKGPARSSNVPEGRDHLITGAGPFSFARVRHGLTRNGDDLFGEPVMAGAMLDR
jgi:hypothetical protein